MSDLLPPYVRDADQSPPPPPEAVQGQAGRPAVSPPQESALPLSGGGAPPAVVNFPPPVDDSAAGGDRAAAPALPPSGIPVGPITQADYDKIAPRPAAPPEQPAAPQGAGTLTPPKEAAIPVTPGPGGTAVVQSPEPAKTAAAPPPKQPAPEDRPLATTPGAAALPQPEVASAPYKGTIPMNGYNFLANKQPEVFNTIADIGQQFGVTPERLIQHARMESGLDLNAPDGKEGEQGPFQILPSTQQYLQDKYLNGRQLDPKTWEGGATLAALKVRECDQRGADSYASVACYNGGGDGAKAYAANFFSDKKSSDYSKLNFGDFDKPDHGSTMTANGAINAGRAGPDQFQKYIVDTAPRGQSMTDAWQHVQSLLLEHFVAKGDMDGAEKAQDFVMRQAFMGSNMHLMGAAASLERGDGATAAQQLAKAHAFFPDGTAGRFMTNGTEVFGVRLDEATGKPLGQPFKITAQDARAQLQVTGNPMTFAKFLTDQQKSAAEIRLHNAQAGYQEVRPAIEGIKEAGRGERSAATIAAAQGNLQTREQYTDRRQAASLAAQQARDKGVKDAETQAQVDKFVADATDGWAIPPDKTTPEQQAAYTAQREQLVASLKRNAPGMNIQKGQVQYIVNGLLDKTFTLKATPDGFAAVNAKTGERVANVDVPTGELFSGKMHPVTAQRQQQQSAAPQQGAAPGGGGAALAPYATGNAVPGGRSSVTGVQGEMAQRVEAMVQAMPPEIRRRFEIISGYRDAARQHEVNPRVTNSRHMYGKALDLGGDPAVINWITAHPEHGLGFPLSRDPKERNHMEMIDPRTRARAPL